MKRDPLRVVIDTNVMISGLFWRGASFQVLRAWRAGRFRLIYSTALLNELTERLRDKFLLPEAKSDLLSRRIVRYGIHVRPRVRVDICRDPRDNMLLEAALAGRADYLGSGDEDLTILGQFRGIAIVTPREFLDVLSKWKKQ